MIAGPSPIAGESVTYEALRHVVHVALSDVDSSYDFGDVVAQITASVWELITERSG